MPKSDAATPLDGCAPVAQRVTLFYATYPTGRVITRLVSHGETEIVFRAAVYRTADDRMPAATGWASERVGEGDGNTVACLEATETSAVGRALANLGLTASRSRPRREEMEEVARSRATTLADRTGAGRAPPAPKVAIRTQARRADISEPRQRLADRVTDTLQLLAEAERAGLASKRSAEIRRQLAAPSLGAATLAQAERALRQWLTEHHSRLFTPGAVDSNAGVSSRLEGKDAVEGLPFP